jgi:ferredoxin
MYNINEFHSIVILAQGKFRIRQTMANKELKTLENVPGAYYVDNTCIDCGLCPDTAPNIFKRFDSGGYTVVHQQPDTLEAIALAEEARSGCPTESIGNDGA